MALQEEKKIKQKDALDILIRLHVVLKIAKVYEPNNLIFQEQAKVLLALVQNALKKDGEAVLCSSQNVLSFNGQSLKFDFSSYHVYQFITEEFTSREIGVLEFLPGLTEEELSQFLFLLAKKEAKKDNPFEPLLQDIQQNQIHHVSLERILRTDRVQSQRRSAAEIYFLGIPLLKDIYEKEKRREKFDLNVAKRWMQSMYQHIIEEESFIYGLTNIKNTEEYTLNHSINVCVLSIALGRRLGLSRQEIVELGISAFFHDVGKNEIPEEIWLKPSKLSEEERALIEQHPQLGAEKLLQLRRVKNIPLNVISVAMEHHIKADGTGYPKYFKKKSIHFYSKIVKIVDCFDALTTKRVFRTKVFTKEEAMSLMLEKSGEEFDPLILKVFVSMIGAYPIGSLVVLNSGEMGIVFEANPQEAFKLRPKVKLITDEMGNRIDGPIVNLTEVDPQTKKFKKTIVKSVDPDKYNFQISDYFLALAQ
ncbi:MAG: HD domain-containing phosphohydrolase [Candidatus Aminicenantales bacterium]